ncbi:MAG: hypothetical protein U0790_12875 [Isosphaeraceae bacterium]
MRLTLRRMMIVVGVISINLAALRALISSRRPDLSIGALASLGVLQVGLSQVLAGRGHPRAFWLGFIAGSVLAIIPMLANIYTPQSFLAAPWLIEDRFIHVPLEDVRNALFQSQSRQVHLVTGSALLWTEFPAVVLLISVAAGRIALEIHRRREPFDERTIVR